MISANRYLDKLAIITGAAGGIGLASAMRIASEGGTVVLVDLSAEKLKKAQEEMRRVGHKNIFIKECDVSNAAQVEELVHDVMEVSGHIDLIVNNAGLMCSKPLEDHTLEDWGRVLNVDLLGAFLFIQQGFRNMKPGSSIVNISSIHAVETTPNVCSYAAAKAALVSLTRSAALEGKAKGIRVNAILPGAISTPMLWDNPNVKAGLEVIKMTDVGKTDDVASAVAYLGSEDSTFIQGAALRVDGGRLAMP